MEDRALYHRLLAGGGRWAWTRFPIWNFMDQVNILDLGRKGFRSASDAQHYYHNIRESSDSVSQLMGERARALVSHLRTSDYEARTLPLLPAYFLAVYGPRLVRAAFSALRSTPKTQAEIQVLP